MGDVMSKGSMLSKKLAALGLSASAALSGGFLLIPHEGEVKNNKGEHVVYLDPVGIPTYCWGLTGKDMYGKLPKVGNTYTKQECMTMFTDRVRHFEYVVDKYAKHGYSSPYQKAGFISFAYNVGEGNYASSTMLRKFNKGDMEGACEELLRWKYAQGKILSGLVDRRQEEKLWCLGAVNKDVIITFNDIVNIVKDTNELRKNMQSSVKE